MSEWYYRTGERIYGPYSENDLRGRIKSGKIPSSISVSRNGFSDWQTAPASLLEDDSRSRKAQGGATSRRKFAWPFKRPPESRSPHTGTRPRSRKRLLRWCLGVIFVGIIACVIVKDTDLDAVSDWVQSLSATFQSSDRSHYTLDGTRKFWVRMRQSKKTAEESLAKLPKGKYPYTPDNQPDMMRFTDNEFETFKQYQFKRAKIAGNFVAKLDRVPTFGVDPALLHYKEELREVWQLLERGCLDYEEIANDTQEHRACFASPEAFALRFGTNSTGTSEMEYRRNMSRQHVLEKITSLTALLVKGDQALANVNNREQEVKTLLTSRYGWKFE